MLEHRYIDLEDQIKRKSEDLSDIAKGMGKRDAGGSDIRQQIDMKRLDRIDEEMMRLEGDLLKSWKRRRLQEFENHHPTIGAAYEA
jgi:hypothetical protein